MTTLQTVELGVSIAGKQVCQRLDLAPGTGELWGILGLNGVGKTTLLHTLAGLRNADAGEVRIDGRPLTALPRHRLARHLGVLFQHDDDAFPGTVLETALVGRHPHLGLWAWESAEDMHIARAALQDVGLTGMESRALDTLSGGERRRLAIAALLTQDPAVMLLDEPTSHLDLPHQLTVLALLRERVRQGGRTALAVFHDVNLAARYCDRLLLLLGAGDTLQGTPQAVLTPDNLQRLYGHPIDIVQGPEGPVFVPR